MSAITKAVYLVGACCPKWAWHEHHQSSANPLSPGERLLLEQGMDVGVRARGLYPSGTMVSGPSAERRCAQTRDLITTKADAIFEGTAQYAGFEARADILIRERIGWRLVEVKSGLEPKDEYFDDVAYTLAVFTRAGIAIDVVSLMLLNRNWRLGAPAADLFIELDCTAEAKQRSGDAIARFDRLSTELASSVPPEAPLRFYCKSCPHFETQCHGVGIESHIFDLPRLSDKKFTTLASRGITRISDIPADFELTEAASASSISHGIRSALGRPRPPATAVEHWLASVLPGLRGDPAGDPGVRWRWRHSRSCPSSTRSICGRARHLEPVHRRSSSLMAALIRVASFAERLVKDLDEERANCCLLLIRETDDQRARRSYPCIQSATPVSGDAPSRSGSDHQIELLPPRLSRVDLDQTDASRARTRTELHWAGDSRWSVRRSRVPIDSKRNRRRCCTVQHPQRAEGLLRSGQPGHDADP